MIPKYIQPYFETISEKNDGYNNIVEGEVACCNKHNFEVFVKGKIKKTLFSGIYVYSEDRVVFEAHCKECGKIIHIFDSDKDGYDHFGNNVKKNNDAVHYNCKKCNSNSFSINIKYEYPNIQELQDLNIDDVDNAFTWIRISLRCNKCNKKYHNLIDYETG